MRIGEDTENEMSHTAQTPFPDLTTCFSFHLSLSLPGCVRLCGDVSEKRLQHPDRLQAFYVHLRRHRCAALQREVFLLHRQFEGHREGLPVILCSVFLFPSFILTFSFIFVFLSFFPSFSLSFLPSSLLSFFVFPSTLLPFLLSFLSLHLFFSPPFLLSFPSIFLSFLQSFIQPFIPFWFCCWFQAQLLC